MKIPPGWDGLLLKCTVQEGYEVSKTTLLSGDNTTPKWMKTDRNVSVHEDTILHLCDFNSTINDWSQNIPSKCTLECGSPLDATTIQPDNIAK